MENTDPKMIATDFIRQKLDDYFPEDDERDEEDEYYVVKIPKNLKQKLLAKYDRGRVEHNYDDLRLFADPRKTEKEMEEEAIDLFCYEALGMIVPQYMETLTQIYDGLPNTKDGPGSS